MSQSQPSTEASSSPWVIPFSEVKAGVWIVPGDGHTCLLPRWPVQVEGDENGELAVRCAEKWHLLYPEMQNGQAVLVNFRKAELVHGLPAEISMNELLLGYNADRRRFDYLRKRERLSRVEVLHLVGSWMATDGELPTPNIVTIRVVEMTRERLISLDLIDHDENPDLNLYVALQPCPWENHVAMVVGLHSDRLTGHWGIGTIYKNAYWL